MLVGGLSPSPPSPGSWGYSQSHHLHLGPFQVQGGKHDSPFHLGMMKTHLPPAQRDAAPQMSQCLLP